MNRRQFVTTAGALSLAAATPAIAQDAPKLQWRLASSFPNSLDTIFDAAKIVADRVSELTSGQFEIQVYSAGEIVPPLAVLDNVGNKTVEMGHSAGFYYIGKEPSLIFDTGVPFGMTPRQHNAWYHQGGGEQQMDEIYARYGIKSVPCCNTGAQMAGWFNKPIEKPDDLSGLKMRVAGFGGRVYEKLGVVPQQIPGGDVYASLEKGALDAVEWVGPYDDEKLGLHKVAKYYYAPGVVEMGAMTAIYINREAWDALPPVYQTAIRLACREAEVQTLAAYDAKNAEAIGRLVAGGTQLGYYPAEIVGALGKAAEEALDEEGQKNAEFAKILEGWRSFRDAQRLWFSVNDSLAERLIYYGR